VSAELMQMLMGFRTAQAIHVAATLRIPDLLADGPRSSAELAEPTEADGPALHRLLRALAAVGVFHEDADGRFSLTPLSERLRSDVAGSVRGWALLIGRPYFWRSWGNLEHSIRTGENAFRALHDTDVWDWRSREPEESEIFDDAMKAMTGAANAAILDEYDFGRFSTVVDVGGGNGTLLAAVLARHPEARGILFDQPHVVDKAGVVLAPVAERAEVVAGDFFESVPAGGDAYLLKSIVHDWEDGEAATILTRCRAAMGPDARVLVIERIVGPPNQGAEAKFSDLNMLVMPGGRERTEAEFAALFERAGLHLVGTVSTASGHAVLEAAP
jgi:hypothetical protein